MIANETLISSEKVVQTQGHKLNKVEQDIEHLSFYFKCGNIIKIKYHVNDN